MTECMSKIFIYIIYVMVLPVGQESYIAGRETHATQTNGKIMTIRIIYKHYLIINSQIQAQKPIAMNTDKTLSESNN